MRILFTGISSFTGCWFARALVRAGHELTGALRGSRERYEGVRRARVDEMLKGCRLIPDAPFGSEPFLRLITEQGPWDVLCHHAAETTNYRSPDFDVHAAVLSNTLNLRAVLAAFKHSGAKAVVLTGSVFENDEGRGDNTMRAFSGYGLAKGLSWQIFRFYCEQAGIPLGKFVIPNPFGPWEEPRFTAYLMNNWKQGKVAAVKTPDYHRDNIHIDLLTNVYVRFVSGAVNSSTPSFKVNPSGYVETQGAFSERLAREVRSRTGWVCDLRLLKQEDFSEPLERVNIQPARDTVLDWDEMSAWDSFVRYYTGGQEAV